jgi:hypothetical protein
MIDKDIDNGSRPLISNIKPTISRNHIKAAIFFEIIAFIFISLFAFIYAFNHQPEGLSGTSHYQEFLSLQQGDETLFPSQDSKSIHSIHFDDHLFILSILLFYVSSAIFMTFIMTFMRQDMSINDFLRKRFAFHIRKSYYYMAFLIPLVNIVWCLYIFHALATAMDDLIAMKNDISIKMRTSGKFLAVLLSFIFSICIPVCMYLFNSGIISSAIIAGIFNLHWMLVKHGRVFNYYFITFLIMLIILLLLFIGKESVFYNDFIFSIGITLFVFLNTMPLEFSISSSIIYDKYLLNIYST